MEFQLNDDEKKYLLKTARKTIADFLKNKLPEKQEYFSENLKRETGAFVTLHKNRDLRGCIGYVSGYAPLQEAVADLAVSAAFRDPRFSPLKKSELSEIDIEISVLTPLENVNDISEIKIGRDGLKIKQPPYEGLLLPQVAAEYGWDVETFLEHTCSKAGLPSDAWKDESTEIKKFSALIFGENEFEELP
jgi:AmmeMemoRadiSam system protein A